MHPVNNKTKSDYLKNNVQFLRLLEDNIKNMELEEYGMIINMYREKDEDMIELIKDNNYSKKTDLFPI